MTTGLSLQKPESRSLWTRLTEPHPSIQDVGERRRTRLIASLLLSMALAGIGGWMTTTLTGGGFNVTSAIVTAISVGFTLAAYALSRTPRYQQAALIATGLVMAAIFASAATSTSTTSSPITVFQYFVLAGFFAALTLSFRKMVGVMAVSIGVFLLFPALFSARLLPSDSSNITTTLIFLIMMYGVIIIFVRYRDALERDRQVQLTIALHQAESANGALAHSQAVLLSVIDNLPQSVFWKDRQSHFLGMNEHFFRDSGMESLEQMIGKDDYDMPWNERAAQYIGDDQAVMESDTAHLNYEEQLLRADGTEIWLRTSKVPMHAADGTVSGLVIILEDITERKQVQEELQRSQQMLRLVMDTIPQNICWKDRHSVYLGGNRNFAETLKLPSPEWLIGKTDFDLDSAANAEAYQAADRQVMESDTPELNFEEPQPHGDGTTSWLRTSKVPLHDAQNNVTGVLVMFEDITERKQQEQEVRESRNLLQLVLNTIPVRVFWKDSDLVYLGCNQLFANDAKLGSPNEIIGRTDYQLFPGEAELYRQDDQRVIISGEQKLNFEEPQTYADGSQIWLRTSKIPLRSAAGAVVGVMGTYDDITAQKVAEQEREILIQELKTTNELATESVRLKSEFMSTMSHELRTPLNAIRGFTGIMLEGMGGEIDDEARHMLGRIDSNSGRLLGLINDLLDIAKIEAGRMELVNEAISPSALAERWRSLMGILAQQKGLRFEITVAPELPTSLSGDSERLTQIVTNLLSNAIKFTHTGQVGLAMKRQAEQWILEVSDTGVGIPPHALNYIFDEFRQVDGSTKRAYGGSGLGLAIVRNLCRMMGGNVKVSSELGKGSAFTVTLPLVAKRQVEAQILEIA